MHIKNIMVNSRKTGKRKGQIMKIEFDKGYLKVSFYVFFTIAMLVLFYKVIDNFSSAFVSF